jgi:hypothetical protein
MSQLAEALSDLRTRLALARRGASPGEERCGFCGWPRSAVPALLIGPAGAICSVCVEHAWKTVLPGMLGTPQEAPPDVSPMLVLASRPAGAKAPLAEHVQTRANQVTRLLEQVSTARSDLLARAEALGWAIEQFLGAASSDKLLLALPWDELLGIARLLEDFAAALKAGETEAGDVGRS